MYFKAQGHSRVFVTIPRFTVGIPITLGVTTIPNGPIIQAYPDYNWNRIKGRNCDGLTSVFRIAVSIQTRYNFPNEFVMHFYIDR